MKEVSIIYIYRCDSCNATLSEGGEGVNHLANCGKVVSQLQVQLAGCGVAALGGTANPAREGDYGWSPSYQDVLDLRIKFDNLERQVRGNVGWAEK